MYALGSAGDDALYQYSLSTAWDLSTTSYDSVTLPDLNDQEPTAVEGAAFNYDGTRVYIIGQGVRSCKHRGKPGFAIEINTAVQSLACDVSVTAHKSRGEASVAPAVVRAALD